MSDEQPKDTLPGRSLGQFEIQEEIGRGGMATVYRGRQRSMNRIVAIKVLPQHLLHDPGFYERFEREVEVISKLEHPHILPIYDYGQSEGVPYIAMRYLGGGSLEDQIRRLGPLPLEDIETPLRQIGRALDYAHTQGIIHRDLKPGNIMLDEGNNAYLSDFGIARVMGSEMTGSMIIGTPSYMSPEQANGLTIDARSDVYALGVVLFELITGRLPFQAETPMAVLLKHINEDVPPIAEFRDDISTVIENVVRKATAKDPDDRFSSAGEMASAFSKALHNKPVDLDVPTQSRMADEPTIMPAASAAVTQSPKPTAAADAKSTPSPATASVTATGTTNRLILGVVGVILLALLAGAGLVLFNSNGDEAQAAPVAVVPTPFPRARTFDGEFFTISVPENWRQADFNLAQTEGPARKFAWVDEQLRAFVTVTLFDADLSGDQLFYRDAVDEYVTRNYNRRVFQNVFTFIDEGVAEDGTIRRSYRLTMLPSPDSSPGGPEPPGGADRAPLQGIDGVTAGQVDVFFVQEAPYIAVVEIYTADTTGNTLVTRMQSILGSLRITPPASA